MENFQGIIKVSQIGEKYDFAEKKFVDCSLVLANEHHTPKSHGENDHKFQGFVTMPMHNQVSHLSIFDAVHVRKNTRLFSTPAQL